MDVDSADLTDGLLPFHPEDSLLARVRPPLPPQRPLPVLRLPSADTLAAAAPLRAVRLALDHVPVHQGAVARR